MKKNTLTLLFISTVFCISSQTLVKLKLPNNCNAIPQDVDKLFVDKNLELFPNPNSGNFTLIITFKDNIDKATIRVYDTKGQTIYSETVFSNSNKLVKQLRIANLNKSTYLFEVKNSQRTITTKLVIN